jgi:UDP-N-acetylglucosamine 2-epimerase
MILLTYGTRPEWIKIKPLINEMVKNNIPYKTLFTGQHKDIAPSNADYNLTMFDYGGNRLDSIIKNCLSIPDTYFENITHILVQGDTTSVVGLAITAINRGIKIIHLEAGLRTYDFQNPFPEEYNRRIVSSISSINLCPTNLNKENLIKENVSGECYVVGNTVLDNLLPYKKDCIYGDTILVTLHRRENHEIIGYWFREITKLSIKYPDLNFIIPLHPNPNIQKEKVYLGGNVKIVEPMNHDELIKLLVKTKLVISDSGGIQEECSFFNKKVLVCRKVTERPESIGLTSFIVSEPSKLESVFSEHINNYKVNIDSPFGDGYSSSKICEIFKKNIYGI